HDHYGNRDQTSWLNKIILKCCSIFFSSIIAVNQKLKNRSEKKLLCKNVYALSNYPVVNLKPKVTRLEGLPNKRIVCLANLRPDKDHENLIKAFSKIKQIHPDWSLHLIGNYIKNLYFESITNLIKELQLENQVYLYGSCPDVFHILKQSTIGVLSSKSEGLPLALLEYGIAGLPSVATNVGDCNLVISNKNEGFLIESEDVNALKNALLSLIVDEKLRQNMGACLKEKVMNNFSEAVQIHKLIEIYKLHIK
uniref:glycosyltransferase n=1 Tax=Seonamhaeicola sp. TaxID=1912245 RepID=UPI0035613FB6